MTSFVLFIGQLEVIYYMTSNMDSMVKIESKSAYFCSICTQFCSDNFLAAVLCLSACI